MRHDWYIVIRRPQRPTYGSGSTRQHDRDRGPPTAKTQDASLSNNVRKNYATRLQTAAVNAYEYGGHLRVPLTNEDVGLRHQKLILTRISAKPEKRMLTRNYGKNRGRLRDIPASIETHIKNCADLYLFIFLAIYLN